MKYQATKKVTGGKLVRVKIEADDMIRDMKIYGDFFLHPEDSIPYIEERLHGLSRGSSQEIFAQEIEKALAERRAAFIGITPDDLAATIMEALEAE